MTGGPGHISTRRLGKTRDRKRLDVGPDIEADPPYWIADPVDFDVRELKAS